MDASDAHLERALAEYNDTVNELEPEGPSEQLLEAYVNRASVLTMMDYRTSAMEDLESADEMIRSAEEQGIEIEDGTFVKTYVGMGDLIFESEGDPIEPYSRAATRVVRMNPEARHFDFRSTVRMCIYVIENLIDSEYPEETEPFFTKAMSMVMTKNDNWSLNRQLELYNLEGEIGDENEDYKASVESYGRAVKVGVELLDREQLEDMEVLVMSYVSKAEAEENLEDLDGYILDTKAAIILLEHMLEYHRLDDTDVLISLQQSVANALIKQGKVEEAEKYLVKSLKLGVQGASDYIRSQTDKSD